MKTTVKLLIFLVAVIALTGCKKELPLEELQEEARQGVRHERTITYTVADSTTTVHLKTDAEFDALLERFCGYAQEGSEVTFYNANRASTGAKDVTNYSTTSREEMISWMRQMEDAGMTVTVTYDRETDTWHGTAYATAPQPQGRCYTGVLVSIPTEGYEIYGYMEYPYWGLKINEDTVLRTTKQMDKPFIIGDSSYDIGDTVTICGWVHAGYNSDYTKIIYYFTWNNYHRSDDLWRPYPIYYAESDEGLLMITVDDNNHKLYSTSTYDNQTWQGSIGGGIFSYEETNQTDNFGNPIIMVYNDALQSGGKRFSIEHCPDGDILLRDLDGSSMPSGSQMRLKCRYTNWNTWACDTMGFNIVIHQDAEPLIKYPPHGYSSSPFYANCTTPFEAGLFTTDDSYSFSPLTYYVSGRVVNFTYYSGYYNGHSTLTLTPVGESTGCVDSYVFHKIVRPR